MRLMLVFLCDEFFIASQIKNFFPKNQPEPPFQLCGSTRPTPAQPHGHSWQPLMAKARVAIRYLGYRD